jgi:LemA protein
MSKGLKTALIVVGVIVLIGFMTFSWVRSGYDNVIAMDENVTGKWAQVENQLKRRYDLIPNLVNTVKGYAPGRYR